MAVVKAETSLYRNNARYAMQNRTKQNTQLTEEKDKNRNEMIN